MANTAKAATEKENKWLSREAVSRFYKEALSAISLALDLEFDNKINHSRRVAYLATKIADKICPEHRAQIFYASLLHDIGTVSLPNHIIHYLSGNKTDNSSNIKAKIINHPFVASQVLRRVVGLPDLHLAADFILEHHENWDGEGFPTGKKKDEILNGSQIITAADICDLLLWQFHKKIDISQLKTELKKQSNKQLSAGITNELLEVLDKETIKILIDDSKVEKQVISTQESLPPFNVIPFSDSIGSLIKMVAIIVDAKHHYTVGHSKRVAEYSLQIASELGLTHDEITEIKWAALLHDVGKISVPTEILEKETMLTNKERAIIQRHAPYTIKVISKITDIKHLAPVAGGHHERFDGKGYPKGLKGDKVPLGARIISVADALDAMTSNRPYRPLITFKEALAILKKDSGSQFDPNVVYAAFHCFR